MLAAVLRNPAPSVFSGCYGRNAQAAAPRTPRDSWATVCSVRSAWNQIPLSFFAGTGAGAPLPARYVVHNDRPAANTGPKTGRLKATTKGTKPRSERNLREIGADTCSALTTLVAPIPPLLRCGHGDQTRAGVQLPAAYAPSVTG
jgi:hypothetical protein